MHLEVAPSPKETISARYLDAALAAGTMTAAELADRLQVEESTVSRWRTGKAAMSRSRWIAVLAVLGLPLDWQPPSKTPRKTEKRGRGRPRSAD